MSGQEAPPDKEKSCSTRALHFTPGKADESTLITSSVRKPKKEAEHRVKSPAKKRLAFPQTSELAAVEDAPSPEFKKRKVQLERPADCPEPNTEQHSEESNPAEEAQTANPPRPPPELPPGVPAPPIPQGRIPQPSPDHGHLPPGTKPKGVLQTIFSPMFHLFQASGDDSRGEKAGKDRTPTPGSEAESKHGRQGSPKQSRAESESRRKSKSRTPELAPVCNLNSSRRAAEEAAQQDELRGSSGTEKAGGTGPSASAASEGASSTDGESDTCVHAIAAPMSPPQGPEDSEGESEVAEEVYVNDAGNDLDDDSLEFDPYAFIKSLPPLEQCAPAWRRSLLPKQTRQCKQKTLVLDLDETLVHSTLDGSVSTDFCFEVFFNNRTHSVNVRQRPHLAAFLARCADLFEVVVFTASQRLYAEQLLNILDPQRKLIRHRIFRDDCVLVEGNYLKDLTVLGRDLAHTVIVDNSPQAFGFQLGNGIPIESWYDDAADIELMRLLPFLESLVDAPDVRPLIANAFNLHKLVAQAPRH